MLFRSTRSDADSERVKYSEMAIDKFFDLLPEKSGLEPERILFVIDGMRPNLYNKKDWEDGERSYFGLMRKHFIHKAQQFGHEIVDMNPVFKETFQKVGKRFEFETDGHWSSYGHDVSFREITQTALYKKFIGIKGETLTARVNK